MKFGVHDNKQKRCRCACFPANIVNCELVTRIAIPITLFSFEYNAQIQSEDKIRELLCAQQPLMQMSPLCFRDKQVIDEFITSYSAILDNGISLGFYLNFCSGGIALYTPQTHIKQSYSIWMPPRCCICVSIRQINDIKNMYFDFLVSPQSGETRYVRI